MPDGLLQTLWNRATDPMVPQSVTQPTVDALTAPHLDQSPNMARIKGFLGGALEGARQQTSPATLLGILGDDVPLAMAGKYLPTLMKGARGASMLTPEATALATASARDIINPTTAQVIDRMYQAAKPTFEGMKGAFAGDRTVGGLHSLASRAATAPIGETMGAVNPYFTPVGGEAAYNAGLPVQAVSQGPGIYDRIMSTMGK
jgi:hypothetical protein